MPVPRRVLIAALVVGVLVALGAGLYLALAGAVVTTARAEIGPAVDLVYATGFVEAEHPVTVSSRLTAPVMAVLVDEGQAVVQGQPLIRLDGSEQAALLAQARSDAHGRALTGQRIVTLYGQGWVTRAARDDAVTAERSAGAAATALAARLDQTTVRAGIAGVVLRREVEPGELAVPGKELLVLGDPARARVTATVDERDIPRVAIGQPVLLSTDAMPGRVLTGHVGEITPGGDPTQRAFRVRIALDPAVDGARALPFGLTLEVNIMTRRHDRAVLVPARAVADGHVWNVDHGRARRRTVRAGIAGADRIEIVSGLAAGETVVLDPPAGLGDGDRVRVRP
jgi:RND family efflux transporter MFP subunit